MKTERLVANGDGTWQSTVDPVAADLVLYFGSREALEDGHLFAALRTRYPLAIILGCSTGGQILDEDVTDDTATAVATAFDSSTIRLSLQPIADDTASRSCGRAIGQDLARDGLVGVFVLSDGLCVNGSELVSGFLDELGPAIPIVGGLAGDKAAFKRTLVSGNAPPSTDIVAAVGFYGPKLRFRTGSAGGWDEFGPKRTITKATGNVLHELDGRPALDLYMRYLGEEAAGLPGTALLFPLNVSNPERPDHDIVRTVLSIDQEEKTMTFAGDVQQGWTAQLMRGRFAELSKGAGDAARQAQPDPAEPDGLAVLVSCIGRRLLMGELVSEEIEAATAELGVRNEVIGFYSYGEIAPHAVSKIPTLHNETMTVMTITEAA